MIKVPFHRLVIPVFFILILTVASLGAQDNPGNSTDVPDKIVDEIEAYRAALRFTGFDKAKGFDSARTFESIENTVIRDNSIPFLRDSIDGRSSWKIVFPNIYLKNPAISDGFEDLFTKDYTVWIDKETGRLLKISAVVSNKKYEIPEELDSEKSERQMGYPDGYVGLVNYYPKTELNDILSKGYGTGYHGMAKRTTIIFIEYLLPEEKAVPVPAWVLTFQGLPPIKHFAGAEYRTWTSIIRDEDGKYILGTLAPNEWQK